MITLANFLLGTNALGMYVGLVSSSPFRKIICFNRFQSRALIKADMPTASRIQDVCPREPDNEGVRIGRSSNP